MKRQRPLIALGALLALVAIGVVLVVRPAPEPTLAERADALARELRCPDCQGLSVADAPTSSAREIRRQIDGLLADDATDAQVRDHFVARYGTWILLAPSSPLPWMMPIAVVLAGAAGLVGWLVVRRAPTPAGAERVATAEERQRVHEEAEALDA